MTSTMRFVLHSSAGYESVCDGVGVTGRHADRSRELRMQRWQPSFGPLEFPRGICWNRGDRLESTPRNGSRMSRSPSDAPVPLERRNGPSASTIVFALRRELPLLPSCDVGASLRGVKPPREAELSTLLAPRSYPSVDTRWHGIVQRRQRTLTSARRIHTSEFGTVSFSRSFYAYVYVDLPQLPMFLDPPWHLLSYHSSRFDQPDALTGTLVDLHLLSGRTSALKNYFSSGSPPSPTCSFTLAISSALYYNCSVPSVSERDLSTFSDRSFLRCTTLTSSRGRRQILLVLW